MNEQDRYNAFSELIARYQSGLYAYIFAAVQNWEDADDLYQATCVVLWRKFGLFRPGSSFFAWARQTARLEIRSFLKRKRSLTFVSPELVDALAETAAVPPGDDAELYLATLQRCREGLSAADEELLRLRYVEDLGVSDIAERLQRFKSNVSRSLHRIRRVLFECMQVQIVRRDCSGKCPS